MACGKCKQKQSRVATEYVDSEDQKDNGVMRMNRFVGVIVFLITTVVSPLFVLIIIGMLFNYLVLQNDMDISGLIKGAGNKKAKKIIN